MIRQTEFRNTVFQYPSNLVERFENRNLIASLHHISGKWKSRGSWTDHCYFYSVGSSHFGYRHLTGFAFEISCKTFQITDSYRCFFHFLQIETFRFTLFFLWTYPSAHCRQSTGLFQYSSSFKNLSTLDIFNKSWNIDPNRTAFHTGRISTILTTPGFLHSHFFRQPGIHFQALARDPFLRSTFGHFHPFDHRTLFRFHSFAQCFPPIGIPITQGTFAMMYEFLHFFGFRPFKTSQARQHLIEINLMGIEFRAVDTSKFGLSTDSNPAGTTHTGTVHHDSIQAGNGRDFIFFSE